MASKHRHQGLGGSQGPAGLLSLAQNLYDPASDVPVNVAPGLLVTIFPAWNNVGGWGGLYTVRPGSLLQLPSLPDIGHPRPCSDRCSTFPVCMGRFFLPACWLTGNMNAPRRWHLSGACPSPRTHCSPRHPSTGVPRQETT